MAGGFKIRLRGLSAWLHTTMPSMPLPEVFTPDHVYPYTLEHWPQATRPAVRASLNLLAKAGKIKPVGQKGAGHAPLYSLLEQRTPAVADEVETIDKALDALAQVERILKAHRDVFARMAELKKLLG